MIRAFSGSQLASHETILNQMFRQRHEIYVKERGWSTLPSGPDQLERDEYDNDGAIYLLALDDRDTLLGGARLLPTTKPHLFLDKFSHLAGSKGVPIGPDIYELTRFYVARKCRAPRLSYWLAGVVGCGTFEYCLENGIRQLSSVVDMFMLNHMLAAGWRVTPLGLPQSYGQGDAVGVLIDITEEGLLMTRQVRAVRGRVFATPRAPVPPMSLEAVRRASRLSLPAH